MKVKSICNRALVPINGKRGLVQSEGPAVEEELTLRDRLRSARANYNSKINHNVKINHVVIVSNSFFYLLFGLDFICLLLNKKKKKINKRIIL